MKKVYIFDVDGTLTPSRGKITNDFKNVFKKFQSNHPTYLVSGSDLPKSLEQLGQDVIDGFIKCFSCLGNQIWQDEECIYENHWTISQEQENFLLEVLNNNSGQLMTGNHIEKRIGLVNFSVIGRNCTQEQRQEYYEWDQKHQQRKTIVEQLESLFDDIEPSIGGQISIDIVQKEKDKRQILHYFDSDTEIHFFGDRIFPGGNDYTLAQSITRGKVYKCQNFLQTMDYLLEIDPTLGKSK